MDAMKTFTELFSKESHATLEGLLGVKPEISSLGVVDAQGIGFPYVLIRIKSILEAREAQVAIAVPASLASYLSAMMIGDDPIAKDEISDEEIDATKEIINNILGALSTGLGADKVLPSLGFEIIEAGLVQSAPDLSAFPHIWQYDISINELNSSMFYLASGEFAKFFQPKEEQAKPEENDSHVDFQDESKLNDYGNISILLDIKLNVHVRIGQKRMLLKDVIAMDIGSVIELNQLANEPLEVLVDDKVIAHGEVVIVDGNFGIQITDIGTKKERLEQIKV